jgi:DNA-cytosine methyltransferase
MKYISLFTGIGGFEVAIHRVFPEAKCLAYSEIKPSAIKVYQEHFPGHYNLGDITKITNEEIKDLVKNGCDLVVGGFPCKNLSALAAVKGKYTGLEGDQSGLFYYMTQIIQWIQKSCPKVRYIFENNSSMSKKNRVLIRKLINEKLNSDTHETMLNASSFGVQSRNRVFWTNFPISNPQVNDMKQTWENVLEKVGTIQPISDKYLACLNRSIKSSYKQKTLVNVNQDSTGYKIVILDNKEDLGRSRWQSSFHSDTANEEIQLPYSYPIGKSRVVTASFGNHNILLDRREQPEGYFIPRLFSILEIERLFGFDDNWTTSLSSSSARKDCLGNSVVVPVIEHIINHL